MPKVKTAPNPPDLFLHFLTEIELSLQAQFRANFEFCRPHLSKVVWTPQFFYIVCEIKLSLQSCAHFVKHFLRSRRATAETETLQRQPRTGTLSEKNTESRAGERFQAGTHAFPHLLDDKTAGCDKRS